MMHAEQPNPPGPRHATILFVLTVLFLCRVLGQLIQGLVALPFLPPFAEWDSGALPYPLLVVCQFALAALMLWTAGCVRRDALGAGPRRHIVVLALGSLYLAAALFRLGAGQSFLSWSHWFSVWLPSLFHVVLASYLLVLGRYLRLRWLRERPRRSATTV